ncbi:MAG TPA: NnrS family protein [Casimicrobiaceae bacterium]|nr:NnrS family protein [Casimicrobiaceae bacterium]
MQIQHARRPDSAQTPGGAPFALWALGMRPFYLLASVFAAVSIPLWALQYAGVLPVQYVPSAAWHGSEMLLGYTLAVVTGFLLTAVRNWTGQPTASGAHLAALAAVWLAGRVLAATRFEVAAACVDVAFPLVVAASIGRPLWRARNRRNFFFVGLLLLLSCAALVLHLSALDVVAWPERTTLRVVLDVMMLIMAIMGGRVIPMFTANAIPGAHARRHPAVERAALGGIVVLIVADAIGAPGWLMLPLTSALAAVHAARLALWQPWRTVHKPLVWVLHAAYAWIVLHLVLRALAAAGLVPDPLAVHALTVGAIGGLTLGMMTRTARGHTGRPLVADRRDVAMYTLVFAAALIRVGGPLAWPSAYVGTVLAAGTCWSLAFALYAWSYAPSLVRARADGRPG